MGSQSKADPSRIRTVYFRAQEMSGEVAGPSHPQLWWTFFVWPYIPREALPSGCHRGESRCCGSMLIALVQHEAPAFCSNRQVKFIGQLGS